jgi:hypothetical protein
MSAYLSDAEVQRIGSFFQGRGWVVVHGQRDPITAYYPASLGGVDVYPIDQPIGELGVCRLACEIAEDGRVTVESAGVVGGCVHHGSRSTFPVRFGARHLDRLLKRLERHARDLDASAVLACLADGRCASRLRNAGEERVMTSLIPWLATVVPGLFTTYRVTARLAGRGRSTPNGATRASHGNAEQTRMTGILPRLAAVSAAHGRCRGRRNVVLPAGGEPHAWQSTPSTGESVTRHNRGYRRSAT